MVSFFNLGTFWVTLTFSHKIGPLCSKCTITQKVYISRRKKYIYSESIYYDAHK